MSDYNSSLPVRTENPGDVIAKIADANTPSQQLAVDASGAIIAKMEASNGDALTATGTSLDVNVTNATLTVVATDLDIRDLSSATDSVEAIQDTHDDLNGNMTIQVADVDVSDANPVPISDAGGSITVDGTVTANQGGAPWSQNLTQINGSTVSVTNPLPSRLSDGAAYYSDTNPVPVKITFEGSNVQDYKDAAAIASGASDNHDYTVTAGKTLILTQIESSASGKAKMVLAIETGVGTGTFTTKVVQFNSTAEPNMSLIIQNPISVAAGVKVRVTMSNRDLLAQDLYSTIIGIES